MRKKILKNAIISAGATASYVVAISSFLLYSGQIFDGTESENSILIPIVMLLLFVISAAITGLAVFGKPIMWYIDGKKKEALHLLALTILFLIIIAIFFVSII